MKVKESTLTRGDTSMHKASVKKFIYLAKPTTLLGGIPSSDIAAPDTVLDGQELDLSCLLCPGTDGGQRVGTFLSRGRASMASVPFNFIDFCMQVSSQYFTHAIGF